MMMKRENKIIIGAVIVTLICSSMVFSQTRIRIPRGRYSTSITGSLPYNYYKSYVVRARAGQSIVARVTSPTGRVVFAEDYETQYFIDLVEDGDYFLDIMNIGPGTTYRLTVTIVRTPGR